MNSYEESDDGKVCYYTGIEWEILRNVTVVCVKSQVRVIKDWAFDNCTCLRTISFNNRLDLIGTSAFCRCRSLWSINIPRYVRVMTFEECQGLMTADFGKGLEITGARAFQHCYFLHHIDIPRGIRSIQKWAFAYCLRLTTSVLNNGLVVIDEFAFTYCSSLECIMVPPTVMEIEDGAFSECTQLSLVWDDWKQWIWRHVHQKHRDPPLCHRNFGWCLWALYKFDMCGVLRYDQKVCT